MALLDTAGKRIKNLREKAQLTQQEVAVKCGISQSAYNRYEKDQIHRYSRDILEKLSVAIGTTPEYILGTDDQDIRLVHYPEYLQKFLLNPDSVPYVAKAYLEYQQKLVAQTIEESK